MMRTFLTYILLVLLVCSCSPEGMHIVPDNGSEIKFTSSRMSIITKAGDVAQKFDEGTKFKLFAVEASADVHNWSNTVLYDRIGEELSGTLSYGDKVSYGVAPLNILDFYSITNGTSSDIEVNGGVGSAPEVRVSMSGGSLPDLMYSDNLKSKKSSDGLLHMEFRHTMARLNIEILKQDESADDIKQLETAELKKVVLFGTGISGTFDIETGTWKDITQADQGVTVFNSTLPIPTTAETIVSGMLAIPVEGANVSMRIYLDGIDDADEYVDYTLKIGEDQNLHLNQNHEYTLSIVILKNDVRIVTVTPKVFDWIDVDMKDEIYFGQPVFFGGLMWMDRNLGAKSADCENDWYNSIGYYYQHGRNIPYMIDVNVWKEKYNTSAKVNFSGDSFANDLIYTLDQNNNKVSTYISATGATDPASNLPYYDEIAKNPGDNGVYSFICGFNSWSSWARGTNNKQDVRNDTYWDDVENQPCPKGWRLPTRKDMYKYLPEEFVEKAKWQESYTQGTDLINDYHSGTRNSLGEVYQWKYFTAKFKASSSSADEWTYPVSDANPRVYLIKYEGSSKAYRIMIEQRKANTVADGSLVKYYVRISRFETTQEDRFQISPDGKKWNLHKFDWENPAEYMDFPLCGYIDPGDNTNSIVSHHPYLGAFGNGCILRSQEIDTSGSLGRNWTMYFMNTYRGVTVGGGSRRTLGDQIRCVRDINAK